MLSLGRPKLNWIVLSCIKLNEKSEIGKYLVKWKSLSYVQLFVNPWTEGVAFPFSRDLPNPGVEPRSPALQADSLSAESQGKPRVSGRGSYEGEGNGSGETLSLLSLLDAGMHTHNVYIFTYTHIDVLSYLLSTLYCTRWFYMDILIQSSQGLVLEARKETWLRV